MTSLVNNLGGAIGFGEYSVSRNDDSYKPGISLNSLFGATGLNFFGTNYSYASINNNGNITLSNYSYDGLDTYTPFGLANGNYAIIAPFFADVDTRLPTGGTASANQVTPTPGGTSMGSDLVWYDLDTTGYGTLTVTWDDVGYYYIQTDKLNAFQLEIKGTGGGNFDAIFRYEDINWTTGDASDGVGGLGGIVARAGYSTGDGSSWYELAQSGIQDAMLSLENTPGNTGISGYYKFSIQNGAELDEILNGSTNDDLISGGGGDDVINSYEGNDYLVGGEGSDTLVGGTGNDTYTIDGSDTLIELANEGIDTAFSAASYTLDSNFENLHLTGYSSINGTGNSAENIFAGNSGDNILNGMDGNDTVDYSMSSSDITVNLSSSDFQYISYGNGYDTLLSIENVVGSFYDDELTGTAGANILNGNLGADTMTGGDGSDIYEVDNSLDMVVETNALASTGGIDQVNSSLDAYTLGANIENGRINTTGTASLTGNSLDNLLYAGSGSNVLDGAVGTDTVSYQYATAGVTVSLLTVDAQATGGSGSDTLLSIENLTGSSYADTLTGSTDNNALSGGAGNDTLDGGTGADTLTGGDGSDSYYADNIGDVVSETNATASTGGTDLVYSALSAYTLGANVENGRINTSDTASLTGNALGNTLYAGAGSNVLDGGLGTDTASYQYATAGVTVSLATTAAQATGGSGSDTLLSVENLTGSSYADKLTGNAGSNILNGGTGADTLNGGAGADTLTGGDGSDTYYVDNVGDVVSETNAVLSTGGTDLVYSALSAYTLGANIENGRINTTSTASLTGNSLGNLLYAGAGSNILDGAAGTDTVSYLYATAGVTVSLASTAAQATGGSGSDTLKNIENLTGSSYADTLTGNAGSNVLNGGTGADVMTGGDGSDTYYVDNAGDVVSETNATASTGGTDLVFSALSAYTLGANIENGRINTTGTASLTGNALGNLLYAGAGSNVLDGAAGTDTASYLYATAGVTVSLATTVAQATGGSGSDTLKNIENLTGSNYADTLTGSTGNNTLNGGTGNDILNGGTGNDILTGGLGADQLTGGTGADRFDFNALTEMGLTSTTWDTITDFKTSELDKIDLLGVDANTALAGDQAFTFLGSVSTFTGDATGQLRFDVATHTLYGSTDADTAAEFAIVLTGVSSLSATDFIL